jgi:uncharacterized protein YndB with AHSA1/START domain
MSRDQVADRFATLTFARKVAAPVATLDAAWTSPAARAVWAPPAPGVTVEFLEADIRCTGARTGRSMPMPGRRSTTSTGKPG